MPPASVLCSRDQLTAYSGLATHYHRSADSTRISIHTDWDTDETVVLEHAGSNDPTPQFLMQGRRFDAQDWRRIETAPGILIEGVRATAWVCGDGKTKPLVDWQPRPD